MTVGTKDGSSVVGSSVVGTAVGTPVGAIVGDVVGNSVGITVGATVVGDAVGVSVAKQPSLIMHASYLIGDRVCDCVHASGAMLMAAGLLMPTQELPLVSRVQRDGVAHARTVILLRLETTVA